MLRKVTFNFKHDVQSFSKAGFLINEIATNEIIDPQLLPSEHTLAKAQQRTHS